MEARQQLLMVGLMALLFGWARISLAAAPTLKDTYRFCVQQRDRGRGTYKATGR